MADDAMVIFHAVDTNRDGVLSPLELSTRLSDFGMTDDQVRSLAVLLAYDVELL